MLGKAAIAGAGLGGLAAATSLAMEGWAVEVFEQGDELREDGACIWLGEMALTTLGRLGALDEVLASGTDVEYWEMIGHDGTVIQSGGPRLGSTGRLHWLPRAELHRSLVEAGAKGGSENQYQRARNLCAG
ncbi:MULTISPECIES: NAD(P)-binding protein [unclassified Mesorhizobium]|uniref:NAD(P)-binding protein n=1 Tax=unclassified Mesorhizobium TaxID=325217 RepID=UPI002961F27B|nr:MULTISPECIES: NAD(P)-binding protein [unclassified Mesorhizobium]